MTRDKAVERIQELINILNEASKAYYDDASEIMTNYEYDRMYDELESLEKETGIVMANSPTVNVGYTVRSELPKVQHEKKMLSLDKTKDRDELRAWLGNQKGLLSWKLDGLTVVLTYAEGVLVQAVTRGNGTIGELVTDNARAFKNVPYTIPYKGRAVVRGEAVIRYSTFNKINDAIAEADAKYKNPRNLCSGSVRQLDSRITAERNVEFYAFTLSSAELDLTLRSEQMEWMKNQGFDTVAYVPVDENSLLDAIDSYEKQIPDFDIPSDGLVLTLEDLAYAASLGTTAKFPKDSLAFKWRDQQAETVLREIEWSPSRTGLLNPVAVFDPVELEGTTVSRASVHNINIMEDLQLGIGDTITVYKANMIIPQISDNLTRSNHIEIPPLCPVCSGATEIKEETGTKTLVCTNPECLAKHVKSFSHFVTRDAMNIEGLSEAGLLKFIGKGILKSLPDIYDIEEHRDEIVTMEGFGVKSFDNLVKSINKSRQTTPARLLYSLGITGVGVNTANIIARACRNSWAAIESLTADELMTIDKIGSVIASDIISFMSDDDNKQMIRALLDRVELDENFEEAGTALAGKVFVITGSLEHYGNRKELKADIEAQGGKVAGSVSSATDYLITNNPSSGSSKNKAARELGVAIIDEAEIIEMLNMERKGD
ncbi:MAG: NAD-dependent DNA ligase LigA [Clostridiales bacterium]|nr:NAD-dependent DNA ligase LigA [Candidatus Crickella merdequi]